MASDTHDHGDQMKAAWSKIVAGWERHADLLAEMGKHVSSWMVKHLDPKPGQTVLELGAGPGDTGFAVAKILGPQGKLISTDLSPEMSEVAKRRVAKFGVTNVDFRVMDAQKIDLAEGEVDGALHRFGPMLMNDPPAYLREVRRVLRPRGRYVAAVWAASEKNPWLEITPMSLKQSGIEMPPADPNAPGPFSFGDPDVLGTAVADAGFNDVVIEPVDHTIESDDFDGLWGSQSELTGALVAMLMKLPKERAEVVKENFRTLTEPYRSGSGYRIPGQALCVSAR